jgi:hypothetical protein
MHLGARKTQAKTERAAQNGPGTRYCFRITHGRFYERIGLWVLKNSLSENSRKIHRVRMSYKRFSRTGRTFSITGFAGVCAESEFFNTHACYRQVRLGIAGDKQHMTTFSVLTQYPKRCGQATRSTLVRCTEDWYLKRTFPACRSTPHVNALVCIKVAVRTRIILR